MRYLDLTLATPQENLALDEALLEEAEQASEALETLRFWESTTPMIVLGRSSRPEVEVYAEACQRDGVPVLRRTSGGATIITGPGCLMYALVLSYTRRPALRAVDVAHHVVLDTLVAALRPLVWELRCQGISDLALDARKCSGNSVRCRRQHLLYHGTLLYRFPLASVEKYLRMPPREPQYRGGRSHDAFLANLPLEADVIRTALRKAWQADEPMADWPRERTAQFVAERYSRADWNGRVAGGG
jgi:lipoate-protein ligase A